MLEVSDDRFNYKNYSRQPQWLVRQAIAALQDKRNADQLTQARYMQMFANANRDPKAEPYSEISMFMPYPSRWIATSTDREIQISRATAIEFLQSYTSFDADVDTTFTSWMQQIRAIAQGD